MLDTLDDECDSRPTRLEICNIVFDCAGLNVMKLASNRRVVGLGTVVIVVLAAGHSQHHQQCQHEQRAGVFQRHTSHIK
ncbi:MAG TPA: hypothetical protein DD979_18455 [Gammaproteobacteria bacterium]|nr:hypothetical protein [Gammaproteobacteria bacterium]